MLRRSDGIPNDIAQLRGLRLVIASEPEQGRRLAESKLKQLTGMGTLQARFLHREYFEFDPTFKIFIDGNHKPEIRGTENAIWNRTKLIPFSVSIPENEIDKTLLGKLKNEAPGILAWTVRGCLDWQRQGKLGEPDSVRKATSSYRDEMDVFADFLEECCALGAGGKSTSEKLYVAYKQWCSQRKENPLSKKAFGSRLKERGLEPAKLGSGQRIWQGIALQDEEQIESLSTQQVIQ